MRDRSFATQRRPGSQPHSAPRPVSLVAREFTPEQLDCDDLAQALRGLLGEPIAPDPDLLLASHRVSHVVGAEEAP